MRVGIANEKRSKSERMVRHVLKLMRSMPQGGMDFDDFFDDEEADMRTIQRDLSDLKKIADYMDIDFHTPGPGRSKEKKYMMDIPIFDDMDAKRTFLMEIMLERFEHTAMGKIMGSEPEREELLYRFIRYRRIQQYIQKMRERVVFMEPEVKPGSRIALRLEQCLDALSQERAMDIVYKNKQRRLYPLGLVSKEQRWYLLAIAKEIGEQRIFRLDRMQQTTITTEHYIYPQEFSLRQTLADVWSTHLPSDQHCMTIRLRVCGMAAEELSNVVFHQSQSVEELPDGRLEVSFQLRTWQGMIGWILRWGDLVEVLEPMDLRQEISDIAHRAWQQYQL